MKEKVNVIVSPLKSALCLASSSKWIVLLFQTDSINFLQSFDYGSKLIFTQAGLFELKLQNIGSLNQLILICLYNHKITL